MIVSARAFAARVGPCTVGRPCKVNATHDEASGHGEHGPLSSRALLDVAICSEHRVSLDELDRADVCLECGHPWSLHRTLGCRARPGARGLAAFVVTTGTSATFCSCRIEGG